MKISQSLTFIFADRDWLTKVLIGSAVCLVAGLLGITVIGLLSWLVLPGYMIAVARRVIASDPELLPAWDDWGGLFVDGLMSLIIFCVYVLIPMLLFGGVTAIFENFLFLQVLIVIVIALPALLILAGLGVAALGRWIETGVFTDAFRFGELVPLLRRNPRPFIVAAIVLTLVYYIVPFIGMFACIIGAFLAVPMAFMIMGHLVGQAYIVGTGLSIDHVDKIS